MENYLTQTARDNRIKALESLHRRNNIIEISGFQKDHNRQTIVPFMSRRAQPLLLSSDMKIAA